MKKIRALLLVSIMVLSITALTACGRNNGTANGTDAGTNGSTGTSQNITDNNTAGTTNNTTSNTSTANIGFGHKKRR